MTSLDYDLPEFKSSVNTVYYQNSFVPLFVLLFYVNEKVDSLS